MKIKSLFGIIAILAVLALVVAYVNRAEAPAAADPRVEKTILDAPTVEKAAKLKLTDQGKTVLLTKQADGTWSVSSYYDLPADFSKLSQFVSELTGTKIQRLVTSNPEKLSRLEFKDTQIALLDSADKPLWSVTLGKNSDTGGRFLRFGDETKGYLAAFNAWLDTESKNWANSALVTLKPEEVAKVEVSLPEGPAVVATRAKKEDRFKVDNPPAGQTLNETKITALVSTLTSLRFSDTSETKDEKAVAAKEHSRTAKLTSFDGKTLTVTLGRKPEEKIVKAPTPGTDGKTGPAALGSVADLTKKDEPAKEGEEGAKDAARKPVEPVTETVPAGPTFAFITLSDSAAPINALMQRRAFQVFETAFTNLPEKASDLFEPAAPLPAPAPAPKS